MFSSLKTRGPSLLQFKTESLDREGITTVALNDSLPWYTHGIKASEDYFEVHVERSMLVTQSHLSLFVHLQYIKAQAVYLLRIFLASPTSIYTLHFISILRLMHEGR